MLSSGENSPHSGSENTTFSLPVAGAMVSVGCSIREAAGVVARESVTVVRAPDECEPVVVAVVLVESVVELVVVGWLLAELSSEIVVFSLTSSTSIAFSETFSGSFFLDLWCLEEDLGFVVSLLLLQRDEDDLVDELVVVVLGRVLVLVVFLLVVLGVLVVGWSSVVVLSGLVTGGRSFSSGM